VKSEVQSAIADLKKAIEGNDIEAIKTASEHAAQVSQKMGTAIYQAAQAQQAASGGAEGAAATEEHAPQDEGVVDAEIVDEGEGEGGAA
jgi:molecular chaperone DnaK